MKKSVLALGLLMLSTQVHAGATMNRDDSKAAAQSLSEALKTCTTDLKFPDKDEKIKTTEMIFEIFNKDGNLSAKVTQLGETQTTNDVTITEGNIRDNLRAADAYDDSLTDTERLVLHAMTVTQEPSLKDIMNAGLDLDAVKSAKVYTVGKPTKFGSTSVVEAKDAKGQEIGSFLGGFMVSPCR